MSMSHKDFVLIANVLREARGEHFSKDYSAMTDWEKGAYDAWNTAALAFAGALKATNPLFDFARFMGACKGEYVTGRDKVRA